MERVITCIGCPMGCQITVTTDDATGAYVKSVGYTCKKGLEYSQDEVTNPTRMVTSVVPVKGSVTPLSVKTARFIPKSKIFDCLAEIQKAEVTLPVHIGDIIIPNVCDTGIDVVATRNLE